MREHIGLFKGKRTDNGEWVEGFYHRVTNNWTHENVHYITRFQDMPITGETILTAQYEVDPDTIGECTGLKDKNDKLIFEGNIVEDAEIGLLGDVVFSTVGVPSFGINDVDDGLQYHDGFWHDIEIIGTIHDNPELLKRRGG